MSSPDGELAENDGSDPEIPDHPASPEATSAYEALSQPFSDQILGEPASFEPTEPDDTLAGPPEGLDERQPEPAMPETIHRQPAPGTFATDGPVDAAEPNSGAGATAWAEEVALNRAGDVLAALERTVSLTEPTPHTDTVLTPPEKVSAAVRKILEPTTNSAREPEVPESIDSAELEALTAAVITAVRKAGGGPIGEAVRAALSDPAIYQTVRRIAENRELPPETIRDVTENARLSGDATLSAEGKLIIGAIILLLFAGIAVPLLAGAAAEIILTNEIAIASLAFSVVALRKG